MLPGADSTVSTEPLVPALGTSLAREIAAGGPIVLLAPSVVLAADAVSGSLWEATPKGARPLDTTTVGDPGLLRLIDAHQQRGARGAADVWWTFPKAILVAGLPGSAHYMILWSDFDRSRADFLDVSDQGVRQIAAWNAKLAFATLNGDRESVLLVGVDGRDIPYVGRARLPKVVSDAMRADVSGGDPRPADSILHESPQLQ